MSVAVVCNLSDGVILGVDSALTIGDASSPAKVYEDAEKLFALDELPIGIATYGMAAIGDRTIGNLLRQFEVSNSTAINAPTATLEGIAELLRDFFHQEYMRVIAPSLEQQLGVPYDQIPDNRKPGLGLVVAGFSTGAYLSEVFNILIPLHAAANSARRLGNPGDIGAVRFATCNPISRYILGYDEGLLDAIIDHVNTIRPPLTRAEVQGLYNVAAKFRYQIVFTGMPIKRGIEYVRFLVELVINHYKFVEGASIVGGKCRIGVVTYRGGKFKILE
ncbi:MAG TPA: hypothetical protein VK699_05470 [Terriglobales bacterium]|jgi:hypothetical protein|nr:hypothetical protein [Terriglobales bacterium]